MKRGSNTTALLLGGGGVLLLGAFLGRKQIARVGSMVIDASKVGLFKAVIPTAAGPFADAILRASAEEAVNPFVTVALGDRETKWGTARAYRNFAGDWTPRLRSASRAANTALYRPATASEIGSMAAAPAGSLYVMPADNLGWGRGLMQLDWETLSDWIRANNWRDPTTNIRKGLQVLKAKMRFLSAAAGSKAVVLNAYQAKQLGIAQGTAFKDPRPLAGDDLVVAGLAAYNSGEGNVLAAYAAKGRAGIDAVTTGDDYSSEVTGMIASLTNRFLSSAGQTA